MLVWKSAQMNRPRSVIVCGGGIVGLNCAYHLARAGFRVTVLERHGEAADSCALGSSGYVSPSHVVPFSSPGMVGKMLTGMLDARSPFYVRPRLDGELMRWAWLFAGNCNQRHLRRAAPVLRDLCVLGRKLYVELADITGNAFELKTEGLLKVCRTPKALEHEAGGLAVLANQLGVEARVLDARQTAALEPGMRFDVAGSIFFPTDAHLTPAKLLPVLTSLLKEMGVRFQWNTAVYGWRAENGRIAAVHSTAGDLAADEFVLTGGSWSSAMLAGLGSRLPLQPGKGYSLTLNRPRLKLTKSIILAESRVAITPMGDTLRIGGTMEISGHDDRVRPERIARIVAATQRYLPDFTAEDFAGLKPWYGYRPVSPDGLPYLGRLGRCQNLTIACGHAMLGVSTAPATGLLVAELLMGKTPTVDLTLLNPDRYS
jgi:D-amino-acid dehydrogenase